MDIMRSKHVDDVLLDELKLGGLGSDLVKEANEYNGNVSAKNFLTWLNIEIHGVKILSGLIDIFSEVELLEHYNDYYKLRIPKQEKSIGFVFGEIENRKQEFGIDEYSVC